DQLVIDVKAVAKLERSRHGGHQHAGGDREFEHHVAALALHPALHSTSLTGSDAATARAATVSDSGAPTTRRNVMSTPLVGAVTRAIFKAVMLASFFSGAASQRTPSPLNSTTTPVKAEVPKFQRAGRCATASRARAS